MENFFKQHLEKIIGGNPGLAKFPASYIGRVCYLELSDNRRAKIEYAVHRVHEQYEKVSISILGIDVGKIDSVDIIFQDIFDKQDRGYPYIWDCEWYRLPGESDWVRLACSVLDYVSLFK